MATDTCLAIDDQEMIDAKAAIATNTSDIADLGVLTLNANYSVSIPRGIIADHDDDDTANMLNKFNSVLTELASVKASLVTLTTAVDLKADSSDLVDLTADVALKATAVDMVDAEDRLDDLEAPIVRNIEGGFNEAQIVDVFDGHLTEESVGYPLTGGFTQGTTRYTANYVTKNTVGEDTIITIYAFNHTTGSYCNITASSGTGGTWVSGSTSFCVMAPYSA